MNDIEVLKELKPYKIIKFYPCIPKIIDGKICYKKISKNYLIAGTNIYNRKTDNYITLREILKHKRYYDLDKNEIKNLDKIFSTINLKLKKIHDTISIVDDYDPLIGSVELSHRVDVYYWEVVDINKK